LDVKGDWDWVEDWVMEVNQVTRGEGVALRRHPVGKTERGFLTSPVEQKNGWKALGFRS
jgi:hypothetical protein